MSEKPEKPKSPIPADETVRIDRTKAKPAGDGQKLAGDDDTLEMNRAVLRRAMERARRLAAQKAEEDADTEEFGDPNRTIAIPRETLDALEDDMDTIRISRQAIDAAAEGDEDEDEDEFPEPPESDEP